MRVALGMWARPLGSPPPASEASGGEGLGVGGSCAECAPAEQTKKDPPPGSLRSPPSPPLASLAGGGKEQD